MNKSRQEELIELLTNEDFKKWVLKPTPERDIFWKKWLENNPNEREKANAAIEFIRTKKFKEYQIPREEKDQILSTIISQTSFTNKVIDSKKGQETNRSVVRPVMYKIAAVFVFVLTFSGVIYWNSQNKFENGFSDELTFVKKENPYGRKSVVRLPDGTKVILNSASQLTYDSDFGKQERKVRLRGEAFFEVAHDSDKPFRVVSNNIVTTALGTSFNVRAFENESSLSISLRSGKVNVSRIDAKNSDEKLILNPGEGYIISKQDGKIEKVTVDQEKVYGWKDGILVFKDNSLDEIENTLERWYDVNIEVIGQPHKLWRADGRFDNATLERVLQGLSYTYEIEFLIDGKNVELKFK